jgi:ATP-dependent RNA helicase DeaD
MKENDVDKPEDNHSKNNEALEKIVEPENSLPPIEKKDLPEKLQQAIDNVGWNSLSPVQSLSIPYQLQNRDLMVQARTGSGKTGAFLLPIIEKVKPGTGRTQALILVPTRELARQVAHEAETLLGGLGMKSVAVYGGVGYGKQREALKEGCEIVVGTPGRVLDHMIARTLDISALQTLIFDEADRMLSIGFYPDMKEVQSHLPRHRINTNMFSATFPEHVLRLAGEFMIEPQLLSLSSKEVHVTEIEHVFYEVPAMGKERHLMRILEMENPSSAIIFCNTKANVNFVTAVLKNFGFNAGELSSDLSQSKRERILNQIRSGEVRFLVATDVAARGIDIPDLSHVILYEPPEDKESYIHRAGRTGRAGSSGIAISLVDVIQKLELQRIATRYGIDLQERTIPENSDVMNIIEARLSAILEAGYRSRTILEKERIARYKELVSRLSQDEDQLTLVAMLLDDLYQKSLHARPEQPPQQQEQGRGRGQSSGKRNSGNSGRKNYRGRRRGGNSGSTPSSGRGQPQRGNKR